MSEHVIGIAGAHRNACVGVWKQGALEGICELERVTRVRHAGLGRGRFPNGAFETLAGRHWKSAQTYVMAERDIVCPWSPRPVHLEHHFAHAATSFLTSPFTRAAVLVCDRHSRPEVSIWQGNGAAITNQQWPWAGPGFAHLYSACAEILGFEPEGQEHRVEALARVATRAEAERLQDLWQYADGTLHVRSGWERCVARWVESTDRSTARRAEIARSVQEHLGALLLQLLADVRRSTDVDSLCLAGGLFYNTYFTSIVQQSGLFAGTFVPINPGNAGLAAGAALAVAGHHPPPDSPSLSPFLGPGYRPDEIKETLDNCKLTYDFVTEQKVIERTASALRRGQLVGWFQDRMEWGPRALGHRSILADPRGPHVLDNLNTFLKKGDRHRAYGVSVLEEHLDRHFIGPPTSPFMEYEYEPRDPELFSHVMPARATRLRVQTVGEIPARFRRLHQAYADVTGMGVLVNTSFNGFFEPIVCSPRDAVRVFFGIGLDLLVIDRFLISK